MGKQSAASTIDVRSDADPGNDIWVTIKANDTSILTVSDTMAQLVDKDARDFAHCRLRDFVQDADALCRHVAVGRLENDDSDRVIELRLKRSATAVLSLTCKMSFFRRADDWIVVISRYLHRPTEPLLDGDIKLQRWFQLSMESAGFGHWEHSFVSGVTTYSESLYSILGRDLLTTVLDAEFWHTMVHPEDVYSTPEMVIATDTSLTSRFNTQYRIKHHTGRWIWVEDYVLVVRDSSSWRAKKMIGMCRDVTESRSIERFVSELPMLFCSIDRKNEIAEVSGYWLRHFGFGRDDVIGRGLGQFQAKGAMKSLDQDILPALWAEGGLSNALVSLVSKAGEFRDILMSSSTELDANGEPFKALITMIDVTDRKVEQEALFRIESQFKEAFTNAAHGMALARLDGKFEEVNQSLCAYLDYSRDELLALDFQTITAPDHKQDMLAAIYSLRGGTQIKFDCELQFVRSDGELVWGLVSVASVKDRDGRPNHLVVQLSDIDSLKRANQQLHHAQKMDAIGQLTSGIAHDFNNLLTIVQGNLQLLKRMDAGRQFDDGLLDTALHASKRGTQLIAGLQAFSRKQDLVPKSIDVHAMMDDVRDMLLRTIGAEIQFKVSIADDIWRTKCDETQLTSALVNLAVNARDAMPGGGELVISAQNSQCLGPDGQDLADCVKISATDTGTGMSDEVINKVLQPYFTTKPQGSGTGLGLSMVAGFVEQSGGNITLESTLGVGTTVCLFLPRDVDGCEVEVKPKVNFDGADLEDLSVLVVEDDETLRITTGRLLQSLGCRVIEAFDGVTALRLLAEHRDVDILFSDIVMPGGINGFELAHEVELEHPNVKILLTSGHRFGLKPVSGEVDDKYPVLDKPFDREQLMDGLHAVLGS